jgi:hypothetical protein
MVWYPKTLFFRDLGTTQPSYSFSGDNVYSHSTFRPETSAQAYFTSINRLIDILSRREVLYRHFFENKNQIFRLPYELTASPQNPLLAELKASFLFLEPTNYLNEMSTEVLQKTLLYSKYLHFSSATVD